VFHRLNVANPSTHPVLDFPPPSALATCVPPSEGIRRWPVVVPKVDARASQKEPHHDPTDTRLGKRRSLDDQSGAECGAAGATLEPHGFLTDGFANAEAHYAGSDGTPSLAHAHSSHAVSQYDVACVKYTASH
jgi:hypothetical protein